MNDTHRDVHLRALADILTALPAEEVIQSIRMEHEGKLQMRDEFADSAELVRGMVTWSIETLHVVGKFAALRRRYRCFRNLETGKMGVDLAEEYREELVSQLG